MKRSIPQHTPAEAELIAQAKSFEALRDIAFKIIKRLPQPLGMVCGPISTGGRGSAEENLRVFAETIATVQAEGKNIFSQMPFEDAMHRIRRMPRYNDKDGHNLLETFYLPLFSSGLIKTLHFLPDWQSSVGATWEHAQAKRLKLEIVYL